MPGDFGDESGEKLFDWLLKLGQQVGEDAMRASAKALAEAFRQARGGIDKAEQDGAQAVSLKMDKFQTLPAYDSIKEIIDERLSKESINHEFAKLNGIETLYFNAEDAPAVYAIFKDLEQRTSNELDRAVKTIEESREINEAKEGQHPANDRGVKANEKETPAQKARPSDQEPLVERTERAKASSTALATAKNPEREMKPLEVRGK